MEVQFLRLLCVSYVNVCLGDVLPLKHELLSHESNRSHPMHGEIIFRIKGRVIVQDKFIVFLDSKFETRSSSRPETPSSKSLKNQELSLNASDCQLTFNQYCTYM